MDNWVDVVERAAAEYDAHDGCVIISRWALECAGRVFVEAAMEKAAKVILENCHDDMTRDEEAAAIRALKDKLP